MSEQKFIMNKQSQSLLHNSLEFEVICKTDFGEEVRICGNTTQLGNWNPLLAHRLCTDSNIYPKWKSPHPLRMMNSNQIEFKACIIQKNTIQWERNVENRKITCLRPLLIQFAFNHSKQYVAEGRVVQIYCRQGIFSILQQMQSSESSIEFKSNYPIENYFNNLSKDELQSSRQKSSSQLSSNLFNPSNFNDESQNQQHHQLKYINNRSHQNLQLIKSRSIKPQLIQKSNNQKLQSNIINISHRQLSRNRSLKKQDSSIKKSEELALPYMIHVPNRQHPRRSRKKKNSIKIKKQSKKTEQPQTQHIKTEIEQNCQYDEKNHSNKSNSTIIDYDTEDQYLTNREQDIQIQPSNDAAFDV